MDIKRELTEIRKDVDSGTIASAINGLSGEIKSLVENQSRMVSIKVIWALFGLVFALVFGIESVQYLFKHFFGIPL